MMSIENRREQEKNDMKHLILEASIKIINDEGYEKLSMRKIADVINYSPTTIYIYYKDKAQIAEDIAMKIYEKIVNNIIEVLADNPTLTTDEQFYYCCKEFIESMTSHPEMGIALIRSGSNTMFQAKDTSGEMEGENLLQEMLKKGQQENVFKRLDKNVSWMILSALIGFSMNAIENQLYLLDNWNHLIDTYLDILMRGLLIEKGRPYNEEEN